METDAAIQPDYKAIDKLADALAKAQGEFPVIPKDSLVEVRSKEGKFLYSYKYADLTTIIAATRPALSKHGISFTQGIVRGGFSTLFLHSSGQQLESGFVPCELPKSQDYKAVAGAITYIKRISLTAALGVSADEDVDAAAQEAGAGNSTEKPQQPPRPNLVKPPAPRAPPQPPKVNNNAPADRATMDRLLDLMIDRGVHENSITNLLAKGYGVNAGHPPMWVAMEVGILLENEDTTDATIERKFKEVLKRREAAQKKGG